ncbi:mechanosensitive ion channel [Leptolyngbya sp. FACHB-321]|uniref:mechanosensitive ion channel domain-containing protein n=1 Tax=Leptolyngbya sp. FACHB-321 TaxID=2692807 RepID=UPI0016864790|nr:mechanosensitive ion channel domain-containing protein [Leptolyngbya sp. FACHB-321]MBD2037484.1 mechanosensitive ion channel [Leptolyngbya sp. FACHB-321]
MNWLLDGIQTTLAELLRLFAAPLFEVGNNRYSLSLIVTLMVVSVAVFWVSRAVSNLINRRLLVRLGFDRGSRAVVTTFVRYLLTAIGFVIVLQTAGVNLSSLTLFAGVLGIGLGFGLQNLASNFVSGLTLLVEQPIRVGDFIEIDNLLGTVESISIRSTTVRTLDGVFVIVPNIRFVENNIINWSYRDPRCRLHVPVGVAYGSDTLIVTEALLAAARKDPKVLTDPSPRVWFKRFGDSALDFELLVWINQPTEIEPIKSSLYFTIDRELRQRNIEVPFPQQDLNIRNLEQLAHLFQRDGAVDGNGKHAEKDSISSRKPTPKAPNNLTLRDMLRRISYFEQCTDEELLQLIEYGYRQLFPADQIVCEEGTPGESFYIILNGSVEIFSKRAEQYIATLNEGEFFGEMSLLMGIPRSASVRTLDDTVLFVIERNDLQTLLQDHRGLADQIAHQLMERQQTLRQMGILSEFSEETPFDKVRKRLQTLFGI